MSTVMLLYKNVTLLSRDVHRTLKLGPVDTVEFAARTHWMPVAGVEFAQAARVYPIVFVRDGNADTGQITPILLLGLEPERNDFVADDQRWQPERYIPAFVRRYPFVLANTEGAGDELSVCFDSTFPGLSETKGRPLFNEDGTNTEFLNETLLFLNGFNVEMNRTRAFVDALERLDLFDMKTADIRGYSGATFSVRDFLVIGEEKVSNLKGSDLEDLNRQGFLSWIFAHHLSLTNLPTLLDLHVSRTSAPSREQRGQADPPGKKEKQAGPAAPSRKRAEQVGQADLVPHPRSKGGSPH